MTLDSSIVVFRNRADDDSSVYPLTKQSAVILDETRDDDLTKYITEYNVSAHAPDGSTFTLAQAIAQVPNEYRRGGLKLTFKSDMLGVSSMRSYVLDSSIWTNNVKSWYEEGNNAMVGYYTCTSGANQNKVVNDASGYVLSLGGSMKIKFTLKNTLLNPTLNINGQGAKTIVYDGSICSSTNTWEDGETIECYYDGSVYQLNNVAGGGTFATGQKVKNVGIDNKPINGSNNLVKSNSVFNLLKQIYENILLDDTLKKNLILGTETTLSPTFQNGYIDGNGNIISGSSSYNYCEFSVTSGNILKVKIQNGGAAVWYGVTFYDSQGNVLYNKRGGFNETEFIIPHTAVLVRIGDISAYHSATTIKSVEIKSFVIDESITQNSQGFVQSGYLYDLLINPSTTKFETVWNISSLYPTGGVDGGLTYTFEGAVYKIPSGNRVAGTVLKYIDSVSGKYVVFKRLISQANVTWGNRKGWQTITDDVDLITIDAAKVSDVWLLLNRFFASKNLVNILHEGTYFSYSGLSYGSNAAYDATDFIAILPNTNYVCSRAGAAVSVKYIDVFDKNLNFKRHLENVNSLTSESDEYFVAITFNASTTKTYQFEIGTTVTPYSAYNPKLKDELVDTNGILDGAVTKPKLGTDVQYLINENVHENVVVNESATFTSTGMKTLTFEKKLRIKAGEWFSFKVTSDDAVWSRLVVLDGTYPQRNYWDGVVKDERYYVKARYDITELKLWIVNGTTYGTLTLEVTYNHIISNNSFDTDSISIDKIQGVTSVNLVNLNDPGYTENQVLSTTGSLYYNASYDTTGFIKVIGGTSYSTLSTIGYRIIVAYDSNKNVVSDSAAQNLTTYTTPQNAAYVRVSYQKRPDKNYLLTKGSTPLTSFVGYEPRIPANFIEETNTDTSINFYLPKDIYVAVGRTIELYYEQILLHSEKYNVQAVCSIGKSLERKFQIIGDVSHIGNYTLTINIYDDLLNLLATGSSTIHIVDNTISNNINLLPIGDSLTNQKPWLGEIKTLSSNKIISVGTRGNNVEHTEGRSGVTISSYNTVNGSAIYTYDNNYVGGEADAQIFDESQSYSSGEYVRVPIEEGSTTYRVWVFTSNHAAGAFNPSEAYCISTGNPFYDWNNQTFSMNFYKSFNNISYDVILILLGTNGINLTPETNPSGALGMKTLIDRIRVDEPTKPIIIVNTPFRSNQNGIGTQGNVDGYHAQSEFKFSADLKTWRLAKAIEEMLGEYSNVYFSPVAFTFDSKYNYNNVKTQVNPRLTNTDVVYELFPTDSVHPQTPGYMQMADEIFSTLCYIINQ